MGENGLSFKYNQVDSREADAEHERMRNLPHGFGGYAKVYQDPEDPNNTVFER